MACTGEGDRRRRPSCRPTLKYGLTDQGGYTRLPDDMTYLTGIIID